MANDTKVTVEVSPSDGYSPIDAITFSGLFADAWGRFKEAWSKYVLSTLTFFILSIVIFAISAAIGAALGAFVGGKIAITAISSLVASLAWTWVFVGVYVYYLAAFRNRDYRLENLITSSRHEQGWLAYLVYQFVVHGGLLLLIVPGIIWSFKYIFAINLVLDKGLGIKDAMEMSARMTYGHKWRIFRYTLGVIGIIIFGMLALGVGLLVALPVIMLMWTAFYDRMLPIAQMQASVPIGNTTYILRWGLTAGALLWLLATMAGDVGENRLSGHPDSDRQALAFEVDPVSNTVSASDDTLSFTLPEGYSTEIKAAWKEGTDVRPAKITFLNADMEQVASLSKPIPETDALFGYQAVGDPEYISVKGSEAPVKVQSYRYTIDEDLRRFPELVTAVWNGGYDGGEKWLTCSFRMNWNNDGPTDVAMRSLIDTITVGDACGGGHDALDEAAQHGVEELQMSPEALRIQGMIDSGELRPVASPKVGATSYYTDGITVYFSDMYAAAKLDTDPSVFKVIGSCFTSPGSVFDYASDGKKVWCAEEEIIGADPNTFKEVGCTGKGACGGIAIDKYRVYIGDYRSTGKVQVVTGAYPDLETFKWDQHRYGTDRSSVYCMSYDENENQMLKIVEAADPKTFGWGWAGDYLAGFDAKSVYYGCNKVEAAPVADCSAAENKCGAAVEQAIATEMQAKYPN